ncbi:Uncharacterised protein [[Flavobacterium] thermophilum]|nr:hypothetical protein GARCT_01889 [Geobacillus sp. 12AMOR1]STO12327.1 Uncharacterised protein [[Flavobacterium] thermophilum]
MGCFLCLRGFCRLCCLWQLIWIAFSIGSMGCRLERIERLLAALGEEKGRL